MILSGCSCGSEKNYCHIVIEAGEGFTADSPARTVLKGESAEFKISLKEGYELSESENYSFRYDESDGNGRTLFLRFDNIKYSETLRLSVEKSAFEINYYANGGIGLNGENQITINAAGTHLRPNTEAAYALFIRDGCTQTGWNTMPDKSGVHIGTGSRADYTGSLALYAEWEKWTDISEFDYVIDGGFAEITKYNGSGGTVCVPGKIEGCPVRRIAEGAFYGAGCGTVILPESLYEVEKGAFRDSMIEELYIFDNLEKISDYGFEGCENLKTLHINAVLPPVYSGNYFDTFQDKYDRLLSLKGKKKIILFSGSSTRFGYDCEMFKKAFPEYEPVNMGVFAYTPALPQLLLILDCVEEGDMLIDSPEFDASNRQFCAQKELDYATFAMMESNYDTFAKLDIRDFTGVFTAFSAYNAGRMGMEPKSYNLSASDFDEDGNAVYDPSYNEYGDYILYRPNSESKEPVYGLPVNYTINAFPKGLYIDPLNEIYSRFKEKGADVYFTYAPRNSLALSKDSSLEERARLHGYFQDNLCVPVITELEDSLFSGIYLYGTDNHLSTEGVKIRTENIISALRRIYG